MNKRFTWPLFAGALLLLSANTGFAQSMMSIPIPGQGYSTYGGEASIIKFNAAVKLMNHQQYAEAAEKFKACIALNQKFIEAYFNYAICFMQMGKFQEALIVLNKAQEIRPKYADVYLQRAICFQRLGQSSSSVEQFGEYLRLKPKAPNAAQIREQIALMNTEATRSQVKVDASAPDYLEEIVQNGLTRWQKERMPLKVHLSDGKDVPHYRPEYDALVREAFADWSKDSDGKVSFVYTDDPDAANIDVKWTNKPEELLTSLEGGHAATSCDGSKMLSAVITLLTTNPDGKKLTEPTLKRVMLHEVGHSLGIAGHSSGPGDIMFSTFVANNESAGLSKRDTQTLVALYSADDDFVAKHPVNLVKMNAGDFSSPLAKALKLNADALEDMKNEKFEAAATKLQEAQQLKPNEKLLHNNLGAIFQNWGRGEQSSGDNAAAVKHYKQAIEQFEKARNTEALKHLLPVYADLSEDLKDPDNAKQARDRLSELK
jgi:tetratricopeptide (TPR) repeat protein